MKLDLVYSLLLVPVVVCFVIADQIRGKK